VRGERAFDLRRRPDEQHLRIEVTSSGDRSVDDDRRGVVTAHGVDRDSHASGS
jgi:hypothetical protein